MTFAGWPSHTSIQQVNTVLISTLCSSEEIARVHSAFQQSRDKAPCVIRSMYIRSPSGQPLTLRPAHSEVVAGRWQQCFAFVSQALQDPGEDHHACMGMPGCMSSHIEHSVKGSFCW